MIFFTLKRHSLMMCRRSLILRRYLLYVGVRGWVRDAYVVLNVLFFLPKFLIHRQTAIVVPRDGSDVVCMRNALRCNRCRTNWWDPPWIFPPSNGSRVFQNSYQLGIQRRTRILRPLAVDWTKTKRTLNEQTRDSKLAKKICMYRVHNIHGQPTACIFYSPRKKYIMKARRRL